MKTAFSSFIYSRRGIYGILHILILLMSLFLVISISIDTFHNIPFLNQGSYLKIQFWICMFFLFDFLLEFFLSKEKGRYFTSHFIFLLVSIPYLNIIDFYHITFSPEIDLIRSGDRNLTRRMITNDTFRIFSIRTTLRRRLILIAILIDNGIILTIRLLYLD